MKMVFTTGEAAKLCRVSQQTIIRCFDNGTLKGFKVPGSRFRRIPRDHLYRFMKESGLSTAALEPVTATVAFALNADSPLHVPGLKQADFPFGGEVPEFVTEVLTDAWAFGSLVAETSRLVKVIVVDAEFPQLGGEGKDLVRAVVTRVREKRDSFSTGLIVLQKPFAAPTGGAQAKPRRRAAGRAARETRAGLTEDDLWRGVEVLTHPVSRAQLCGPLENLLRA